MTALNDRLVGSTAAEGRIADEDAEMHFYIAAGPLAAVALGMALVPLRGFTTPSNFAFAFVVLTVLVAEFGGRWPAIATAVASALSLDFFLTQPYLRLTIYEKHDVIAFFGLAACGLVAAAFGKTHGRKLARLTSIRRDLELIHAAVAQVGSGPLEPRLEKILRAATEVLPVAALVLRDQRGYVLAGSDPAAALRAIPDEVLETRSPPLFPHDPATPVRQPASLPGEGCRIALSAGDRPVGWLDVWGDGHPANAESRRVLGDLSRIVSLMLAVAPPG